MLNATVDPDWQGRWSLQKAPSDAVSPRVANSFTANLLAGSFPLHSQEQRLYWTAAEPLPRGIVDWYRTSSHNARATVVRCQSGVWPTKHESSLARRPKLWRWPVTLVQDAHCTSTCFC